VEVVIHSYRHRFGLVAGDPALEEIERSSRRSRRSRSRGDPRGRRRRVTPPDGPRHAFTALRGHEVVPGAGHNLPQEAPDAFAAAVLALL
jgi:pimeloyl-ACP methyl ester carboxylesterase